MIKRYVTPEEKQRRKEKILAVDFEVLGKQAADIVDRDKRIDNLEAGLKEIEQSIDPRFEDCLLARIKIRAREILEGE